MLRTQEISGHWRGRVLLKPVEAIQLPLIRRHNIHVPPMRLQALLETGLPGLSPQVRRVIDEGR